MAAPAALGTRLPWSQRTSGAATAATMNAAITGIVIVDSRADQPHETEEQGPDADEQPRGEAEVAQPGWRREQRVEGVEFLGVHPDGVRPHVVTDGRCGSVLAPTEKSHAAPTVGERRSYARRRRCVEAARSHSPETPFR